MKVTVTSKGDCHFLILISQAFFCLLHLVLLFRECLVCAGEFSVRLVLDAIFRSWHDRPKVISLGPASRETQADACSVDIPAGPWSESHPRHQSGHPAHLG